jgi:hypothetical protein
MPHARTHADTPPPPRGDSVSAAKEERRGLAITSHNRTYGSRDEGEARAAVHPASMEGPSGRHHAMKPGAGAYVCCATSSPAASVIRPLIGLASAKRLHWRGGVSRGGARRSRSRWCEKWCDSHSNIPLFKPGTSTGTDSNPPRSFKSASSLWSCWSSFIQTWLQLNRTWCRKS